MTNTTTRKSTGGNRRKGGGLAKALMSAFGVAGARARAPKVLAEHRLTGTQVADVASKVVLRHIPGKGLGLVARRDLPANTRIGVYGGKVFTARAHERLAKSGATTGKYAVDFFRRDARGRVRDGYIMEPGLGDGMHPRHANVLAAFINEPAEGQTPNVVWVRNLSDHVMELWTVAAVPKGAELTACYGDMYPRQYSTPCTRRPGVLHTWQRGMKAPKPA